MSARAPRVLYLQYANPALYPPVMHGASILAGEGAEVRIVGTRPRVAGEIAMPAHPRIRLTVVPEATGIRGKLAFARFVALPAWTALRFRPDWVYVSDAFAAPAGLLAAPLGGARLLYHEHDVHTERAPSLFTRLCMAARARAARTAAIVVVPSQGRATHLRQTLGVERVSVVMNCPRRADVGRPRSTGQGALRLAYHGTIVPQRLPLAVADALGTLGGAVTLQVVGYEPPGAEGHVRALVERVAARGAPGAIEYLGVLPLRDDVLDRCASADAGLAFIPLSGGDVNMLTMAGASNKAFDYLARGVPVIVSELPDWQEMFVAAGYACSVRPDDESSLVGAFRWLLEHRRDLPAMGAAGQRRVVEEWNYEHQFAPVARRLLGEARVTTPAVARSAA